MQQDPSYNDVLLDVFDTLEGLVTAAEDAGIDRHNIILDPGIGFGKAVVKDNLALLNNIALFHTTGLPIFVGASRKRFIGAIAGVEEAAARMPGSLAVATAMVAKGVQILRVHDVAETRQAVALQEAFGDADSVDAAASLERYDTD